MILCYFANLAAVAVLAGSAVAQAPPPPPPAAAQSTANPDSATPAPSVSTPTKFLAADVHITPPYRVPFYSGAFLSGDRYIIHQATMIHLVTTAWDLKQGGLVGGGPTWIGSERYDIMAKVPPGTTLENARVMLQNLLAERFKLVVHPGDVPAPAYLLVVANGKPNLKPSAATEEGSCKFQPTYPSGPGMKASFEMDCHGVSMETLAKTLGENESNNRDYVPYNNVMVDATGLKGRYDIKLKWTPKWFIAQAGAGAETLYQALAQCGLNMEYKTTPRAGLVIDSVNRVPTPNAPDIAKIMPPLPAPQFEVATIRPAQPGNGGRGGIRGDDLNFQGVPLKFVIKWAWDLSFLTDDGLDAPKWIDSDRIDIHAKIAASDLGSNSRGGSNTMNFDELRPMVRSLIIDRFEIKYHMEDRLIDAYALEVSDPKLAVRKLIKADPSERISCGTVPMNGEQDPQIANVMLTDEQTCLDMTMEDFAGQLHRIAPDYFFYPVKDATGLKGGYDFTMAWSAARLVGMGPGMGPAPAPAADGAQPVANDPNGAISFFDAIKKELGLKVVKEKRSEPVLVIDHIDQQPTDN